MKPRSLVVAAVLLAALSGAVWYAKKHPASTSSAPGSSTTVKVVDIPAAQLQQVTVKKKDGSQISLKRENGKWQIIQPQAYQADQDAVSSLIGACPLECRQRRRGEGHRHREVRFDCAIDDCRIGPFKRKDRDN